MRRIPSVISMDLPSGYTSVNFTVKSVSGQSDETKSLALTGPVISYGSTKTSLVKSKTSFLPSILFDQMNLLVNLDFVLQLLEQDLLDHIYM